MFDGKMKAITFSYDDGVTQDIRLIELFNKYGLKGTFNLNHGLMGNMDEIDRQGVHITHYKNPRSEVRDIYRGHEVACHTLTHPNLVQVPDDAEVIRQVEQDRLALGELFGYEIVGFAFPGGRPNFDDRTVKLVRENTNVRYARGTISTYSTALPSQLFPLAPTVYHHMEFDRMEELAKAFLDSDPTEPQLLYIWGHAYEFDIFDDWGRMDEFLSMISGKKDIFYGTNKQCLPIA